MAETDFWEDNKFEDQVREAKELIKRYQDNRKFALELIIAVFGIGFFINLFTSFLYDARAGGLNNSLSLLGEPYSIIL